MGKTSGSPPRLSDDDEQCFPNLAKVGYRVKSPKDISYNCIAFAAGDTTKPWADDPDYYWPPGADRGDDPESLRGAFERIGYEVCTNGDLETGFQKVALYVGNDGRWTHAARQEGSGEWVSKLGDEEDIMHKSPHCFGGSVYGNVIYFMKRPLAGVENE